MLVHFNDFVTKIVSKEHKNFNIVIVPRNVSKITSIIRSKTWQKAHKETLTSNDTLNSYSTKIEHFLVLNSAPECLQFTSSH